MSAYALQADYIYRFCTTETAYLPALKGQIQG